VPAQRRKRLPDRLGARLARRRTDHSRPGFGQAPRNGGADTATGARDERDLALQISTHDIVPYVRLWKMRDPFRQPRRQSSHHTGNG
jgi:hypothetical protein